MPVNTSHTAVYRYTGTHTYTYAGPPMEPWVRFSRDNEDGTSVYMDLDLEETVWEELGEPSTLKVTLTPVED